MRSYFAVCKEKTHGKLMILRCAKKRQTTKHKIAVCFFYRVLSLRHTAKCLFTVCPIRCTRQTIGHTANYGFPVVLHPTRVYGIASHAGLPDFRAAIASRGSAFHFHLLSLGPDARCSPSPDD